jgi:fatty-acid desaturase
MLFGAIGLTVWAVQMLWIPVMATGIINGIGHWWGYRNFEAADASTNVSPWGILIGGEELHNNHHTYPTSAKFSVKPFEFDIGWVYIRGMELLGLAKPYARRCRTCSWAPSSLWPTPRPSRRHRQPLRGDGQVRKRAARRVRRRARAA